MKEQNDYAKPSRTGFVANYPHFRYWKKSATDDMLMYQPINIYIHVPFCMQKCAYCFYKTNILKKGNELEEYTEVVCREIKLAQERFHFKQRPLNSVYIGGGTPSLLTEPLIRKIVDVLQRTFKFEGPEFTIEVEPRTVTKKKLTLYKELGTTRISMGVQSFCDEIIKMSERKHTAEKALEAIDHILDMGDVVLNIDLLSGLAGETDKTFEKSVDTAVSTNVHSITIYKMETYQNTKFFNRSIRKQTLHLPSEEEELLFMQIAIDKLLAANYKPWSFFTYTRGGNFPLHYAINTWKGQDCCAFGSSAFGKLGNYNYQNASDVKSYILMVNEGKLPIIRAFKLTGKDLMIKDLLLGLKFPQLDRKEYVAKHGVDFCQVIPDTVKDLCSHRYIEVTDDTVILTPKGLLYGDWVGKRLAGAFRNYLGGDKLSLY